MSLFFTTNLLSWRNMWSLPFPTKHSTAKQAATIALKANTGKLILGHFSTRYSDLNLFKLEAETIFPNVELGDDGKIFNF
jgi:ribonuclease Z